MQNSTDNKKRITRTENVPQTPHKPKRVPSVSLVRMKRRLNLGTRSDALYQTLEPSDDSEASYINEYGQYIKRKQKSDDPPTDLDFPFLESISSATEAYKKAMDDANKIIGAFGFGNENMYNVPVRDSNMKISSVKRLDNNSTQEISVEIKNTTDTNVKYNVDSKWDEVAGEDDMSCIICYTNKRCIFFTPCNHMQMCVACFNATCDKAKKNLDGPTCPTCRTPIKGVTRVHT